MKTLFLFLAKPKFVMLVYRHETQQHEGNTLLFIVKTPKCYALNSLLTPLPAAWRTAAATINCLHARRVYPAPRGPTLATGGEGAAWRLLRRQDKYSGRRMKARDGKLIIGVKKLADFTKNIWVIDGLFQTLFSEQCTTLDKSTKAKSMYW